MKQFDGASRPCSEPSTRRRIRGVLDARELVADRFRRAGRCGETLRLGRRGFRVRCESHRSRLPTWFADRRGAVHPDDGVRSSCLLLSNIRARQNPRHRGLWIIFNPHGVNCPFKCHLRTTDGSLRHVSARCHTADSQEAVSSGSIAHDGAARDRRPIGPIARARLPRSIVIARSVPSRSCSLSS